MEQVTAWGGEGRGLDRERDGAADGVVAESHCSTRARGKLALEFMQEWDGGDAEPGAAACIGVPEAWSSKLHHWA